MEKEKQSLKRIFRKFENLWEGDLIDKRKKHHRKTIKNNKGRVRQYLKRETKTDINEYEYEIKAYEKI